MINKKELFFRNLAQTSPAPPAFEVEYAEGIYLYTTEGKKITDLISGIAVNNLGHRHPAVMAAIEKQIKKYLHIMVYGEVVQSPQVLLAEKIASLLPVPLTTTYLVNSGSEANEGALKLAKKFTGRSGIVCFDNAYHGSTHGCLSVIGGDHYQEGYGPMLPDVTRLPFNDRDALRQIDRSTAAVIIEVIQGEGGVIAADKEFLSDLRIRCNDTGAQLIFDEVQTGFGRTGKMFAFEHYDIIPDIITFAKGMGGGMPIGAFTSSREVMMVLQKNPALGHITTFGGHPVSAAAAKASIDFIDKKTFLKEVNRKGKRIRDGLKDLPSITAIRQHGLMIAIELIPMIPIPLLIERALEYGIMTDWFLFCDRAFRIAPPLTITDEEIDEAIRTLRLFL
jgi:acetylornithine/succinyldiaminopimelate/putrescine aminotransferase